MGPSNFMMILAFLMVWLLTSQGCVDAKQQEIRGTNPLLKQDGILVQHVDETRVITKVWSCVIHLNPPKMLDLSQWFTNVIDTIHSKGTEYFGQSQMIYWLNRIDGINPTVGLGSPSD